MVLAFGLGCSGRVREGVDTSEPAPPVDHEDTDTGDDRDDDSPDAQEDTCGDPAAADTSADTAAETGDPERVNGLEVEITWTEAGDDLDLHLVRNGGDLWSDDDCFWANCQAPGLEWGSVETADDDPILASDDVYCTGPELITLYAPAEETYTAYVEDSVGSVKDYHGRNDVTVVVRIEGVEVFVGTVGVGGESRDYAVAQIDWPARTVTAPPEEEYGGGP